MIISVYRMNKVHLSEISAVFNMVQVPWNWRSDANARKALHAMELCVTIVFTVYLWILSSEDFWLLL